MSIHKRAELVFKHYKKYRSTRALGFCVSKRHADFMSEYFNEQGILACAVYSGDGGAQTLPREEALTKLSKGEIQVIFSVDMFNEGLDIASLDMVMMLRPTESPTIFMQQLGRGLRLSKDKHYLNVLDFIGNYKKAHLIPYLITGTTKKEFKHASEVLRNDSLLPEDCFIDFDFQLIDLFERMERSLLKIEDQVSEEYERVKYELGHRPSRVEFFTCMNESMYLLIKSKAKLNPFKNYLAFLQKQNDLTDEEKTLMGTPASEFLTMIEKTSLSKTYKLPTFLAFLQNGSLQLQIDDDDLYKSFLGFYSKGSNGVDLLRDKGTKDFKQWGKKEYVKLARKNPVHFLCQGESDFFSKDNQWVYLHSDLKPYQNHPEFIAHVKDTIDLRTQEFYKTRLEKLER